MALGYSVVCECRATIGRKSFEAKVPKFPRSTKLRHDLYQLAVTASKETEIVETKTRRGQPWMCIALKDNIPQLGNNLTNCSRGWNMFPWQVRGETMPFHASAKQT